MLRLVTTSDKIQAVLSGAVTTSELQIVACYSDKTASAYTGGANRVNTNGTTDVDVVGAPGSSTVRDVDLINVYQRDTASATITLKIDVSGTEHILGKWTLAAGDVLTYTHGHAWQVIDSAGRLKGSGTGGGGGGLSDGDYGDITVSGGGTTLTIDAGVVTYSKIQDISATDRLLGRDTAGAGSAEELTVGGGIEFTGSGGIQRSALTGDVTASAGSGSTTLATVNSNVGTYGSATQASQVTVNAKGLVTAAANVTVTPAVGSITGLGTGVGTFLATPSSANLAAAVTDETGSGALVFATSPTLVTPAIGTPSSGTLTNCTGLPTAGIVDDAVTYAKMQNISATSRVLGRKTAGAGDPEECTLSELLDFVGSAAQGDLLYRGASGWTRLGAGTSGQYLKTLGAGADPAWATVSGGSGGDLVSDLVSSEISITGTATATISRMHVCSGTTSDYTVTLPAASGNAGKFIGFRMATGLTKLVTLDGNASETINGSLTRVMWAGESCILLCDGSNWFKVAGLTKPFVCAMLRNTTTSVSTTTATKLGLNETITDNSGLMADPTTNTRINIKRTGVYEVVAKVTADSSSITAGQSRIHKNGSLIGNAATDIAAFGSGIPASGYYSLAASDYMELYTYHAAGSNRTYYGAAGDTSCSLWVSEIPQW